MTLGELSVQGVVEEIVERRSSCLLIGGSFPVNDHDEAAAFFPDEAGIVPWTCRVESGVEKATAVCYAHDEAISAADSSQS